jgi:flagellar biosynthesis protein FlhA
VVTPIRVEFASDLVSKVDPARDGRKFLEVDIPAMRERVREALGYEVPGVRLSEDPALPPGGYAVKLFNVLTARGRVVTGHLCVMPLEAAPITDAVPGRDPVTGMPCAWVDAHREAELGDARCLSDTGFVLHHLEGLLRQNGFWFLATDGAESWISAAEESEGLEGRLSPQDRVGLTRVLRALVRDGVKLDRLAEMLAAIGEGHLSPEEVPSALQQVRLSRRKTLPGNAGDVVKIPVDLPAAPRSCDTHAGEGWGRPLPPEEEQQLVDTIAAEVEQDARYALVVSEPRLRGYVRRLVESGIRQAQGRVVDVLAAQEVLQREATP